MRVRHTTASYTTLASERHQGKYDYSKTIFTKSHDIITVICPEHGEFYPTAGNHLKKTGCPACYEEIRGANLRMTEEEFSARLPDHYRVQGKFVDASTVVQMLCKHHGVFKATPTRLLQYPLTCPGCYRESTSTKSLAKSSHSIQDAVRGLPKHIRVLSTIRGWSAPITLHCDYHGAFVSALNRVPNMDYVCPECAMDHWKGVARTSFEEYRAKIAEMYPNPPSPITLLEANYNQNTGTKLVSLHCETHGPFVRNRSTINNQHTNTPCPFCKTYGASSAELEMIEFIRSLAYCEQGNRTVITPKEIDCWVPSYSLGVEFCGLYWHSEAKLPPNYHKDKWSSASEKGVSLIQMFEDEWTLHRPVCESIIKARMGLVTSKYYARKLTILSIDHKEARPFLESNHIQGFTPSQIYQGGYMDGRLVCVASFSNNRLRATDGWELVRYCNLLDSVVVGGLSKMVKTFLRQTGVRKIMSYCCLRWFNGSGYESAGFKLIGYTQPSYFYTHGRLRYSRHVAKKHKLERLLPKYNPDLTETENMKKANFRKIYDCGHAIYEFSA